MKVTDMKTTALALSVTCFSLALMTQPAFASEEGERNVAGALAILGVAALLHDKHHYREGFSPANATETADFEAGYRDGLHNYPFDTSYGTRSYNEGVAYNEGYSAGQHEREASHSHQQHRAEGHNAAVPREALDACVNNAADQWGVPWQKVHVTKAKQAAAKDLFLEVRAGRFSIVCEVAPDGQIYELKVGHL